jgi:hypothetical protein
MQSLQLNLVENETPQAPNSETARPVASAIIMGEGVNLGAQKQPSGSKCNSGMRLICGWLDNRRLIHPLAHLHPSPVSLPLLPLSLPVPP